MWLVLAFPFVVVMVVAMMAGEGMRAMYDALIIMTIFFMTVITTVIGILMCVDGTLDKYREFKKAGKMMLEVD